MDSFLRWAGGKKWLAKIISDHIPITFSNYHEPFLGGGSVFFSIDIPNEAFLSDINYDLILTFNQIKYNVDNVIPALKEFKNEESEYYRIRKLTLEDNNLRAAQFIYLNKTSFNGIYRVNRQGQYNVPYGYKYGTDFIQEEKLTSASKKLSKSTITCCGFETALTNVKKNDFVFIDPPYTVAHYNNGFIKYNQTLFSLEDQYKLADSLRKITKVGAYFILTNAFHPKIKEIFGGVGDFISLSRPSLIGGKGATRQVIEEYIIKNF
jgi:DNA adenine methylase